MGNIRWRGYDHPEMYEMINSGSGPRLSGPMAEYWNGLAEELDGISNELNTGLGKLNVAWEGEAADSAQTGLNPLQQWSQDAHTGSTVMGVSATMQGDFVGTAKTEMPPPVKVTTPEPSTWDKIKAGAASTVGINGPAKDVAQQSADHEAQEAAQSAAAQKAVQTMETYQSSTEMNTSSLGTFVPAPDVVVSVNPESGKQVQHVLNHTQSTPTGTGDTSGTTTPSGYTQPHTPISSLPTDPSHNQPHAPIQTPTQTPPTQTTTPNWTNPTTPTTPPTGPTSPVTEGPTNRTPLPTNPTNPILSNPNQTGPGGRNPITRTPLPGEPEGPTRNGTPPNSRGPLGPNEPGPGRGGQRSGLPTGRGGSYEQERNGRLRPGSSPNAFEETRNGGRPRVGGRPASAYSYGEGEGRPGTRPGTRPGANGVGAGRGGAGEAEGRRGGNRFMRNAKAMEAEEGRLGGRGGNANGSRGSGGRMGRGQRGEDEEDYEYQHADYLVDTEDVFLDDRLVAPPVIGERPAGA